jgi:hypothetical protein
MKEKDVEIQCYPNSNQAVVTSKSEEVKQWLKDECGNGILEADDIMQFIAKIKEKGLSYSFTA